MEKIDGLETKLDALGEKLAKLDLLQSLKGHLLCQLIRIVQAQTQIYLLWWPSQLSKWQKLSVNLLSLLPTVQRLIEPVSSDSGISVITAL